MKLNEMDAIAEGDALKLRLPWGWLGGMAVIVASGALVLWIQTHDIAIAMTTLSSKIAKLTDVVERVDRRSLLNERTIENYHEKRSKE